MKRKILKSVVNVVLVVGFFMLIAKAQERRNPPEEIKTTYQEDKAVKDSLFDVAYENQYRITRYIKNQKNRVKVIEKVKYVPIYKVVPIYVPQKDSGDYVSKYRSDTLMGQYYFNDDTVKPVKRSWLYKLLHKNKN